MLEGEIPANRVVRNRRVTYRTKHQSRFRNNKKRHWTSADTCELKNVLDEHPWKYLCEIVWCLELSTGKQWSQSQISRQIKKLGLSLQVVYGRARQINIEQRARYLYCLKSNLKYIDQVVFLDETHKGELSSRRRKHWNAINGRQPYYEEFFGSHGIRYTFISAADIDGFIIESCDVIVRESGDNDTDPCRGTVGEARFTLWVENKLVPILGRFVENEPRSIVVLDNATIHHSPEIKNLIESTGAKVIYTAPYSPDLNPIEFYFGSYKKSLRRSMNEDWLDAHMKAIHSVTPSDAVIFLHTVRYHLQR